MPMTTADKVT